MDSVGSPFQQALHKEYVQLADLEQGEEDWKDAVYFNDRARMSAQGETVSPTAMDERVIPDNMVGALSSARAALMDALNGGAGARKPGAAARAQAGFDCWMQEQEENFQPDDIAACKKMYDDAMAELAEKPMAKPMPKPMPKPMMKPHAAIVILFDFDSAKLSDKAMSQVAEAASYQKQKGGVLNVHGHTDKAGKPEYNEKLSAARANAVADALVAQGVQRGFLVVSSFGESKPAVETKDDVRHLLNRRVVINFTR
ncbi:MAG: OmpA family protein [Hyphomicrobiales bacterium]|nr:OmpA family protein [Hyphomicrobiales bacterium]MCP5373932.1 OmpA family protein [Hyphomicrobiales bacterium]